jgi:hypothetical protein
VDLAAIAQTVSAIGTVLLAALFGYQVTVFKKQVEVNRGTLDEMREGRTAHERPQVVVTAEYRHGTLVQVVISNIGRGDAKNVTFEFSAPTESLFSTPMESSVSYRRDSEVVPLSELPHFRDGLNYLAPGAEIAIVSGTTTPTSCRYCARWDCRRGSGSPAATSRSPGSPTGPPGINPLLIPGGLYVPSRWAQRTERSPALAKRS